MSFIRSMGVSANNDLLKIVRNVSFSDKLIFKNSEESKKLKSNDHYFLKSWV